MVDFCWCHFRRNKLQKFLREVNQNRVYYREYFATAGFPISQMSLSRLPAAAWYRRTHIPRLWIGLSVGER